MLILAFFDVLQYLVQKAFDQVEKAGDNAVVKCVRYCGTAGRKGPPPSLRAPVGPPGGSQGSARSYRPRRAASCAAWKLAAASASRLRSPQG